MTDSIYRDYLTFYLDKQPVGKMPPEYTTAYPVNTTGIYTFDIPQTAYASLKMGHLIKMKVKQYKTRYHNNHDIESASLYIRDIHIRNNWNSKDVFGNMALLTCGSLSYPNNATQTTLEPPEYILAECPRQITFQLINEEPLRPKSFTYFNGATVMLEFSYIPQTLDFNSSFKNY